MIGKREKRDSLNTAAFSTHGTPSVSAFTWLRGRMASFTVSSPRSKTFSMNSRRRNDIIPRDWPCSRIRRNSSSLCSSAWLARGAPIRRRKDVGRAIEDEQEGQERRAAPQQRPRRRQRAAIGHADGEDLGHLLADDDVQGGHHDDRDGRGDGQALSTGITGGEHRRLAADQAQGDRGHGDADLDDRDVFVDARLDERHQLRPRITVRDQLFDARRPHLHHRELGDDEEDVDRQEDGDGEKVEQQFHVEFQIPRFSD